MTLTLHGLKNCDTCKKALKALEVMDVEFLNIREETDLANKLPLWLEVAGAAALVNKRSTTWRSLSDDEKARAEAGDVMELLSTNPTLIKRPVIEANGEIYVGWSAKTADALGV